MAGSKPGTFWFAEPSEARAPLCAGGAAAVGLSAAPLLLVCLRWAGALAYVLQRERLFRLVKEHNRDSNNCLQLSKRDW